MSRADFSDPAIQAKVDEIKKGGGDNWVLVGYVPKSDIKLKVSDSGSGGLTDCTSNLNDGRILFAFVACEVNNTKKFVYISWCGEGVTGMKKGLFSNHSTDVANGPFKGYHVQINARKEDDVEEKIINERLKKATGASYDSGQKNQGAAKLVPTSVAQGRQQAAQSNAKVKAADKGDYDKKDESAQFWANNNKKEADDKAAAKPAPRAEYNKTNERQQFWAQNQAEQQSAQKAQPTVAPGNASSLKNRFENAAKPQEQPPRAAPAPNRLPPQGNAPKPPTNAPSKPTSAPPSRPPQQHAPPPPVHVPEPEPEPEYQEEQSYQEEAPAEEPYQEEQTYQEEQSYQEEAPAEQYQEEQAYQEEPYQEEQSYQEEAPAESYDDQSYANESQGYEGEAAAAGSQARAIYDFDAENETDLSFKEGDIINVLDRTDPGGWYKGELNGVEGYFPSNFVEDI